MSEFDAQKVKKNIEDKDVFYLKAIWTLLCLNRYWALISVVISIVVSVVYLKCSLLLCAASMQILAKNADEKNKTFQELGLALGDVGLMFGSVKFCDELVDIHVTSLSTEVVQRLKLNVSCFLERTIRESELYKNCSIAVSLGKNFVGALNVLLKLTILKSVEGYLVNGCDGVLGSKNVRYYEVFANFLAKLVTPVYVLAFDKKVEYEKLRSELVSRRVVQMIFDS